MIRATAGSALKIWAEPIFVFGILAALIISLLSDTRVSATYLGVFVVICLALIVWGINAVARARLKSNSTGEGVVLLDEGRIGHFGPETGGFVDIDALTSVQLSGPPGKRCWVLSHLDGPPITIPVTARDADQLIDFLVSLDGVSALPISAAIASDKPVELWRARP